MKERIREIGRDPDGAEELNILKQWLDLSNRIAALKKQIKEADAELDRLAYVTYPTFSDAEIKTLVVGDKWLAALQAAYRVNWSESARL